MVERPIKKSERQAAAREEGAPKTEPGILEGNPSVSQDSDEERSTTPRPFKNKEKDHRRGKGKGNREREEQSRPPANPALMRGPKPTKPKPPVIEETQVEATEDTETEANQAATTEP